MGKIRFLSAVVAIAMLMPMLTSCKSGKIGKKVVKEDDPWYESSRFELAQDLGQFDMIGFADGFCAGDDKLFYIYNFTTDRWATSKTYIDTYDFDGDLVKRTRVSYPEGFRLDYINTVHTDSEDKTIKAIIDMSYNDYYGPAFIDIDTETGKISNIKELRSGKVKALISDDAALMSIYNIGAYDLVFYYLGRSGDRRMYQLLLFKDSEFVCELDTSTSNVREFFEGYAVDESANTFYAAGLEGDDKVSLEFDLQTGALKSKKIIAELDDNEVDFTEYTVTSDGELVKLDSFRNITKLDISTMTPKTMVDTNWYNPYFAEVLDDVEYERAFIPEIISCNEERTVIHEIDVQLYGVNDYTRRDFITVIKKADNNPNAGKEIIELALPPNTGMSEYLAKNIYEFNQTDDEYLIRIWSKHSTGYAVGISLSSVSEDDQKIFEMIQELKSDDAPDLAIGIQKNYAMRDEVFMDLTGFLDQEVLDKQYNNIIEAGRIDGKLYFLPVTLEIEGLVTNEEIIKEGAVGITFDEYDRMIKDYMYGYSPYDYPDSRVYNRNSFILSCIDTKSAIEGQSVDFGTEQFRAVIEYAKDKFTYEDENSMPFEYIIDYNRNRGECYYKKMKSYLDFVHACFRSQGNYRIIGTPSVDASGPRFKAIDTISVSATTDVEQGCRKFINYLFSGAAFSNDKCEFWEIVTNKEIMAKNIDALTINNNDAFDELLLDKRNGAVMQTAGAEKAYGDKYATDEMRESFLKSMSTISTYYYEDHQIVEFVLEEIAPYYAGNRTIDETVTILNDRVTRYVREM